MSRKSLVGGLLGCLSLIAVGTEASPIRAQLSGPSLTQMRVVTLPRPSPSLAKNLPKASTVFDAYAVNGRGQILAGAGSYTSAGEFVRYDSRQKRWFPGAMNISVLGPCCGPAYALVGKTVWAQNDPYGVSEGDFNSGRSSLREAITDGKGGWGNIDAIAAGTNGRVWIAGSHEPRCHTGFQGRSACGHTAISLADSRSTQRSPITVGWWGIETGIAVARNGSVWVVLPEYKRARAGPCCRSALIRYDPGDHRFTRFVIPRRDWPEAGLTGGVIGTPYVQRNGSVWIVCISGKTNGVRFIRFRNGSFTSHAFSNDVGDLQALDRNGAFWYTLADGKPRITDPLTGATTVFRAHCGALLPGPRQSVWCVKWQGG